MKIKIVAYFIEVIVIILAVFFVTSLVWIVTMFGFNLQEVMIYHFKEWLPLVFIGHFVLTFFSEAKDDK